MELFENLSGETGCADCGNEPVQGSQTKKWGGGPLLLRVTMAGGREILIPFARAICKEIDVAEKRIRVELRKYLKKRTGRRPLVLPVVMEI